MSIRLIYYTIYSIYYKNIAKNNIKYGDGECEIS